MKPASKYFITAALSILTLTGCGNEDNEPDSLVRKDYPDFSATIINNATSRAYDQAWERGDEIGVTGAGRTNVCYATTAGNGLFEVKTAGEEIYFQDESEVTFTGYYPWTSLAAGVTTINADTKDQTKQKNFDFLWAQAKGKKNAPDVAFNFAHKMVKVALTVQPGDGMTLDEVKAARLSLDGFRHAGSFNVTNGTTTINSSAATGKWVFADNTNTNHDVYSVVDNGKKQVVFSLIFFPQLHQNALTFLAEVGGNNLTASIDFTNANRTKDGNAAKNEWVAGRQYNINLTLHKTEITLNQCVINPWIPVDGGNISVE